MPPEATLDFVITMVNTWMESTPESDWMARWEYGCVLKYLEEYRDIQNQVFPPSKESVIAYNGQYPIIRLNNEIYMVKGYVPETKTWMLFKMAYNEDKAHWYHADDDIYFFDKTGNMTERI